MAEKAVRILVTGRVQGVGYRAWIEDQAEALGLAGWVRNRRDGSVEAVLAGDGGAVDRVIAACRGGPWAANVSDVRVADYLGPKLARFTVLPTE